MENEALKAYQEGGIEEVIAQYVSDEKAVEILENYVYAQRAGISFSVQEFTRYRDALEKIEMMSNGFVKTLAQKTLNEGMDEE